MRFRIPAVADRPGLQRGPTSWRACLDSALLQARTAFLRGLGGEGLDGDALDVAALDDGAFLGGVRHIMLATSAADMSSTILSRPLDVSRFGVIYAGAQKNIGISGLTVVIVRKDLLEQSMPTIPSMMKYSLQAGESSMGNTVPTFAWYVAGLVFDWLENEGGVDIMAERNERKAAATHGEQGTKTDDDGGDGDPAALTDGDMLREIYREIRRTRVARIEDQAALRAEELALAAAAEMVVSDASYSSNAPARDRTIVL